MNSELKSKSIIIILVFIIFVVIRCFYDQDPNIGYMISCMNIISLVYVYLDICNSIKLEGSKRINKTSYPIQIKERKIKELCKVRYNVIFIGALIGYLVFGKGSALVNDIVAMLALVLSLVEDFIIVTVCKKI